jgi:hypothetical protein
MVFALATALAGASPLGSVDHAADASEVVPCGDDHGEHGEEEDHGAPCENDRPCDDCPTGCPNCHCPTALRSLAARPSFDVAPAQPAGDIGLIVRRRNAPSGPDLPSLYRPPRDHGSVA